MKNLIILGALTLCVIVKVNATNQTEVDGQTLHVDGAFAGKKNAVETKTASTDDELKFLQSELNNVKGLKTGYKKKAKVYLKLSEESEELKDQFEGYLDNRVDYEKAISGYNGLVECLKTGDTKKCTKNDKRSRRRRKNGRGGDNMGNGQQQQQGQRAGNRSADAAYSDSLEIRQAAVKKQRMQRAGTNNNRGSNKIYDFVKEVDYRISLRQSDLVACYKRGGLNEEGVLKVVLKIAPNGVLNHIGFKDTTEINDRKIIRCVSRVLYSIVYPHTPSRKVTAISKPFVFNTI